MTDTLHKLPYFAVIFSSIKKQPGEGYDEMSDTMLSLAEQQSGYLGVESAREEIGITVSYWEDLQSIKKWKQLSEHLLAQQFGREKWYQSYTVRICKVEKEYSFNSID